MKQAVYLLFVAFFLISVGEANERHLSIQEAIEKALSNDVGQQIIHKEHEISRSLSRQAAGDLWPDIKIESSFFVTDKKEEFSLTLPLSSEEMVISPEMDRLQRNSITLIQPLFRGGTLLNKRNLYKANERAVKSRMEESKSTLIMNVHELYWGIVKLDYNAEVLNKTKELILSHKSDVESYFKQGQITRVELLKVQERLSQIDLEIIENKNQRNKTALLLSDILGFDSDSLFYPVSSISEIQGALPAFEMCLQTALERSPALEEARLLAEAAEYKAKMAKGAFSPTASLKASYHYDKPNTALQPLENDYQGSWQAGVILSFDLLSGGKKIAHSAEASLSADKSRLVLEKARQSLERSLRALFCEYDAKGQALTVGKRNEEEAEEKLRITRSLFNEGMAVNSDFLDAEAAYTEARIRVLNAEIDRELIRLRVLAVMGALR